MSLDRLTSLDAFRGLTIIGMILVNNPGSWAHVYAPLRHAEWHGWTPTDLIFPFFLFIVGVAMAMSLDGRLADPVTRKDAFRRVIKRSLVIIGLGLFMAAYPRFQIFEIRYPGVLQRIGVVFLCASAAVMYLKPRGQFLFTGVLLLGYWALMTLIPVPGYGPGDLSADGNLAAYLDRLIFGSHTWRDTWDPEGLLSTLPAIATTMTGIFTGRFLRRGDVTAEKAAFMFVAGWGLILLGLFWDPFFPINKNIWTSSYVLFTTGAALQMLGVCYWLIDVRGWYTWSVPAVIFGRNAIAVFVLSGLLAKTLILTRIGTGETETSLYNWLYRSVFAPVFGDLNGSLAFAVTTILFWFGAMWLLYRKRIFITV